MRSSSSTPRSSAPLSAMPDAGRDRDGSPSRSTGCASASRIRAAVCVTRRGLGRRPRAARRTRRRRGARRCRPSAGRSVSRCATSSSSPSPCAWPRASLTALKSSRSTNSTAICASSRAARVERVLDAVVEQRAVGEPGERVVEGAVAQLLLEGLAIVDVARGERRCRRRAGRRAGWWPPRRCGDTCRRRSACAIRPRAALRAPSRAAASRKASHERGVLRMHAIEQGSPCAASQSGPKIGATEPVSVRTVPSRSRIAMRSEEFCTIDCSRSRPSWATSLELEGVLDAPAPLTGEDREQASQRQDGDERPRDGRGRPAPPGSRPGRGTASAR